MDPNEHEVFQSLPWTSTWEGVGFLPRIRDNNKRPVARVVRPRYCSAIVAALNTTPDFVNVCQQLLAITSENPAIRQAQKTAKAALKQLTDLLTDQSQAKTR